ncbi:uncharacterized protein EV422DRAFT_564456 [Fimicolochytrium jonesii]|uniref:uncharacterized protein n=1 Tax=Fimicolochytrium jonesii TaxID=1396493 RepID=UPI0022FDFED5|nr:uncharacterized protein EV422DRAFT_564456 [Fimicolochytrium jonesii]KAI8825109.1 hypothetical protein EV422DRAFT_564456 [Fimicolochytrium jonesii]
MSLPTSATPSSDWRTQDTDEARRRGRPRANTSNSANLPSYGNVKWNLKDRPTESPKRRESDSDADNGNEDELEAIEGDVFGDSDEDLDEDRSQQQSVASYRHSAGNLPTTARSPVRSDTDWTQHPVWKYNITVILENKWVKRLFLAALLISVITMCLGTVDAILRDPALVTLVYGIEATCLSSFTVELLLRWAAATNIRQIFSIQRLIDVLTVLPFYIDVVRAIHTHRALPETAYAIETGAWVRILDLVKLLRLFRFFPKSSKLMLMWRAFSQSLEGLWVLFLSLPLLIITFSTMIFYAEQTAEFWDENARLWFYEHSEPLKVSPFQSIPECFWFVIVTLTTIGYGDVVPATFPGRLIAGALMIM